MLLSIWDVSKGTMVNDGDLSGLKKLTILTSLIQMVPLAFVFLLPHGVDDIKRIQEKENQEQEGKEVDDDDYNDGIISTTATTGTGTTTTKKTCTINVIGGTVYLSAVFASVIFAVFTGIMNVLHPGWMGES